MFTSDAGWKVIESSSRKRRPSPLQHAGGSLARSASVGSTLKQPSLPKPEAANLGCKGVPRSCSAASLPKCPKAVSSTSKPMHGYPSVKVSTSTRIPRENATPPYTSHKNDSPRRALLSEGMTIELHGLQGAVELNGLRGTLKHLDIESGRWIVDVDGFGEKKVKPDNIMSLCESDPEHDLPSRGDCWREQWVADFGKKKGYSDLTMTKQQRRVKATLEALGEAFDPSEGLAAAAASLAKEELSRLRTKAEQRQYFEQIGKPRELPKQPETPSPNTPTVRSKEEQQAYFDLLSVPRLPPKPPTPPPAQVRGAAEQQEKCKELMKAAAWREELTRRGNELKAGEVASAQELLADMRHQAAQNKPRWNTSGPSRPSSAPSRSPTNCPTNGFSNAGATQRQRRPRAKEPEHSPSPEAESLISDLRALVEEVLWTLLLQMRCCKASGGAVLQERLSNLMISVVSTTLRPIARKILPPGVTLVRRMRNEFPVLAMHLSFRESDEMEIPAVPWSNEELEERITEVRACRDNLLSMDLTKMLMTWLNQ